MTVVCLITAVTSAGLDTVTTVLLIAPVAASGTSAGEVATITVPLVSQRGVSSHTADRLEPGGAERHGGRSAWTASRSTNRGHPDHRLVIGGGETAPESWLSQP